MGPLKKLVDGAEELSVLFHGTFRECFRLTTSDDEETIQAALARNNPSLALCCNVSNTAMIYRKGRTCLM